MLKVQGYVVELLLEEGLYLYSELYMDIVQKKHLLVELCHYKKPQNQWKPVYACRDGLF